MRIKKIFGPTIQGEGTHSGARVIFVRFAGCNRWSGLEKHRENSICKFCDTDFFFEPDDYMTVGDICSRIGEISKQTGCQNVVLSGGEPTLQISTSFVRKLRSMDISIHLETNGSREIHPEISAQIYHISMSPKQSRKETNITSCNDIKILYPYIGKNIDLHNFLDFDCDNIFLQPIEDIHGRETKKNIKGAVREILDNRKFRNVRLSLQMHKYIGVE